MEKVEVITRLTFEENNSNLNKNTRENTRNSEEMASSLNNNVDVFNVILILLYFLVHQKIQVFKI